MEDQRPTAVISALQHHKKGVYGKGFKRGGSAGVFSENEVNKLAPRPLREPTDEKEIEPEDVVDVEVAFAEVVEKRSNWPPRPKKKKSKKKGKDEEEEEEKPKKKPSFKYPKNTCCHQCKKNPFRQDDLGGLVNCENTGCQKKYCKKCLRLRYELVGFGPDEDDEEVKKYLGAANDAPSSSETDDSFYGKSDDDEDTMVKGPAPKKQGVKTREPWHCPACLGICNCPQHRHEQGKDAFGHLGWFRKLAREKGFSSVADYAIYLKKKATNDENENNNKDNDNNDNNDNKNENKNKNKKKKNKGDDDGSDQKKGRKRKREDEGVKKSSKNKKKKGSSDASETDSDFEEPRKIRKSSKNS